MCGRYVLVAPGEVIAEHFRLAEVPVYPPSYNIAPTRQALVVRATPAEFSGAQPPAPGSHLPPLAAGTAPPSAGEREAVMLRWGLIPPGAKDTRVGSRMINARAESVADRPAFRAAFRRRRCLVPADGFYEWQSVAGGRKTPYFIRLASGAPLALAGLREQWRPPAGDAIATFTIITTEANEAMRAFHDRMPVLIAPADHDEWLSSPNASSLLAPWSGEPLEIRPVSTRVNSVRNDAPDLLERV